MRLSQAVDEKGLLKTVGYDNIICIILLFFVKMGF